MTTEGDRHSALADVDREILVRRGHPDYSAPAPCTQTMSVGQPYYDICCLLRQLDDARGVGEHEPPTGSTDPLRAAVDAVLMRFEEAEAQGYRSRDRQFAISVLRKEMRDNAKPRENIQ